LVSTIFKFVVEEVRGVALTLTLMKNVLEMAEKAAKLGKMGPQKLLHW
jgi:hypothetical protein